MGDLIQLVTLEEEVIGHRQHRDEDMGRRWLSPNHGESPPKKPAL